MQRINELMKTANDARKLAEKNIFFTPYFLADLMISRLKYGFSMEEYDYLPFFILPMKERKKKHHDH